MATHSGFWPSCRRGYSLTGFEAATYLALRRRHAPTCSDTMTASNVFPYRLGERVSHTQHLAGLHMARVRMNQILDELDAATSAPLVVP